MMKEGKHIYTSKGWSFFQEVICFQTAVWTFQIKIYVHAI